MTDSKDMEIEKKTNKNARIPNFDLLEYISQYGDWGKLERLEYLSNRCKPWAGKCIKEAIDTIKKSRNTEGYLRLLKKAKKIGTSGGIPKEYLVQDDKWIGKCSQKNREEEQQLKQVEAHEKRGTSADPKWVGRIRVSYKNMAEHYELSGDLSSALQKYLDTKVHVETTRQLMETHLWIIRTGLKLDSYHQVNLQARQILNSEKSLTTFPLEHAISHASLGLQNLKSGSFRQAAYNFLRVNSSLKNNFNNFLTIKDLTNYAVLCALATFSRKEINDDILKLAEKKVVAYDPKSFGIFLADNPAMKKLLVDFYSCRYAECFKQIETLKSQLLFDYNVKDVLHDLLRLIREKALVQYFSPFTSCSMNSMAKSFNIPVKQLEEELVTLISAGTIKGRIDSHNKVLYSKNVNPRTASFRKALDTSEAYIEKTTSLILNVNFQQHKFSLGGKERGNGRGRNNKKR